MPEVVLRKGKPRTTDRPTKREAELFVRLKEIRFEVTMMARQIRDIKARKVTRRLERRAILMELYVAGYNMAQLGRALDISRQRIDQILKGKP